MTARRAPRRAAAGTVLGVAVLVALAVGRPDAGPVAAAPVETTPSASSPSPQFAGAPDLGWTLADPPA